MQVRHATVQINNQRAEQAKTRTINALLTASIPQHIFHTSLLRKQLLRRDYMNVALGDEDGMSERPRNVPATSSETTLRAVRGSRGNKGGF